MQKRNNLDSINDFKHSVKHIDETFAIIMLATIGLILIAMIYVEMFCA